MSELVDIPEGWVKVTTGQVLRRRSERARSNEQLLSVTRDRGVVLQSEVGRRDSSSDDKSMYWRVYPDDLVYNTMRMWQGVSGRSPFHGIVSPAYTVCEPTEKADSGFLAHLLKWNRSVSRFYQLSQGLVSDTWNLQYSTFKNTEVLLPPLMEQRRIAAILDCIEHQIDAADITLKKLSHLRTAHMREILSDGLFLLSSLEVSELSSLKGVNRGNWSLRPLGESINLIEAGNSPEAEGIPAGTGEWGVLKVSAVGRFGFRPMENKTIRDRSLQIERLSVQPGDLLMTRANTPELVGLSCVVNETPPRLMLSDKIFRLHIDSRANSAEFLNLLLGQVEIRKQIQTVATGTSGSMKNISQDSVSGLMIPWTQREIQDRIVAIDDEFQLQSILLRNEISALEMLRRGLADDLLSGRVRVPEAEQIMEDL